MKQCDACIGKKIANNKANVVIIGVSTVSSMLRENSG